MQGDSLVFDMATSSRKDPSVFVKKDWLAISDDMNQNYAGNRHYNPLDYFPKPCQIV